MFRGKKTMALLLGASLLFATAVSDVHALAAEQ